MKKALKFSGLVALILGAVALVLMMATHALVASSSGTVSTDAWYSGIAVIFGNGPAKATAGIGGVISIGGEGKFEGTLAWNALLGWIFTIVAIVIVLLGVVLPLLKVKALEKFSGILNLVAIALFAVGGVLLFFTVPAFGAANEWNSTDGWGLGAGWVIAAILNLVAAACAALPVVGQLLKK